MGSEITVDTNESVDRPGVPCCVCLYLCLQSSIPLRRHRESMCRAAAAKKGPPKRALTQSDSSVYLSLALTADRWVALIHRRKKKDGGNVGGVRGGVVDGEKERRQRKPPG